MSPQLPPAADAAAAPATPPRALHSQQATAVVEGSARSKRESLTEVRELDLRNAFAGLPRIKPHWTHK
jgi:hypothetical protein